MKMKPQTCPCCNQAYTTYQTKTRNGSSRLPLLLKCGHTFCETCISSKITKKRGIHNQNINCPKCKSCMSLQNGLKGLHANVYLLGQLGIGEMSKLELSLGEFVPDSSNQRHAGNVRTELFIRKCKICNTTNASCKCIECDNVMCCDCFETFHKVSAAIRDHQPTPLLAGKGGTQSTSPTCEEHGRLIEYFCTDDKAEICSRCYIIGNHKNHSIISFEEKNKELLNDIELETENAQRVIRLLSKSDEKLASLVPEHRQEIKKIVNTVAESFLHLHTLLQVREMEVIDTLHENLKTMSTAVDEKRESFCLNRINLEMAVRDAKALMENNALVIDTSDLLDTLKAAREIRCAVVSKNQTEKGTTLTWNETNKGELVESLKKFGTIVGNILESVDFCTIGNAPPGIEDQDTDEKASIASSISTSGPDKNQISSTISSSDGVIIENSDADSDVSRPGRPNQVSSQGSSMELFQEALSLPVCKGRAQKASITHIFTPNDFLAQLSSNKRKLETLAHNINIWCKREASSKHIPTKVEVGSFVLAKYSVDKTWYRAKVLGLLEDPARKDANQKVHIQYIDYGNEEIVSKKDLRNMEKRFMFYPIFTVRCSLKDIAPFDEQKPWSSDAITEFQKMTENQVLLLSAFSEQNKMYEVDLVYIPNENVLDDSYVSVRDTLVFMELARFNTHSDASRHLPTPSSYKKIDFIKPTPLKNGDTIDMHVTSLESPSHFHITSHGDEYVYYLNMHEEMQEMYGNDTNIYSLYCPRLNMICTVLSKDGFWYRAKVISAPKSRQVTVELVDLGSTMVVGCEHIKKLHSKFVKLPAQAILCRLADISPSTNSEVKWCTEAKHWCKRNMEGAAGIARVKKWDEPAELVVWMGSKVSALAKQSINFLMVENSFAVSTGLSSVGATQHFLYESGSRSVSTSNQSSKETREVVKYAAVAESSPTFLLEESHPDSLSGTSSLKHDANATSFKERSTQKTNVQPVSECETKSTKEKRKKSPSKIGTKTQAIQEPTETDETALAKDRVQHDIKRALSNDSTCDSDFNSIYIEVIISSYESPSDFVLRVRDKEAQLETLMKDMQEEYKNDTTLASVKWKIGQFCAAKHPGDNLWYRGKILDCGPQFLIEMVDYGYKLTLGCADMRLLKTSLGEFMECAAVRCHIANLVPAGSVDPNKWSRTAVEYMKAETKDRKLFIKQEGDINERGLPIDIIVEIEIPETAFDPAIRTYHSLRQSILDKGLAMPVKRSSQPPVSAEPFQRIIFEKQMEPSQTVPEAADSLAKGDSCVTPKLDPDLADSKMNSLQPSAEELRETEDNIASLRQHGPLALPMYPSLPINDPLEVFPTYVDMNGVIYVQPKEWEDMVIHLDYELQRVYSKVSLVPMIEWQTEQVCVAYYPGDDRWYRAVIQELGNGEVRVQYIDYGNTETVKLNCLREMLPEFAQIHPLALYCELHDIMPSSLDHKWPVPVLEYMHELMVNAWCQMNILKMEENSFLQVEFVKKDGLDLSCHLVEQGLASRVSDLTHEYERSALITKVLASHNPFPVQELCGCGETFQATLTHVELPNLVYLQRVRTADPQEFDFVKSGEIAKINSMIDEFELMTEKLNSSKSMPLYQLPDVGFICAAKYSYDDVWYRAIVVESYKRKRASLILYVDFGTSELVPLDRMRQLPSELWSLPSQAIRIYLNIVPPSGPRGFWKRDSINGMVNAIACKELVVNITQVEPLTAELFTEGEEGKLHLAYEKIFEVGLALLPDSLDCFGVVDNDDVIVEHTQARQLTFVEEKDNEKATENDWWGADSEKIEITNLEANGPMFHKLEADAFRDDDRSLDSSSDWTTDEEEEEKDSDTTIVKEDLSYHTVSDVTQE